MPEMAFRRADSVRIRHLRKGHLLIGKQSAKNYLFRIFFRIEGDASVSAGKPRNLGSFHPACIQGRLFAVALE